MVMEKSLKNHGEKVWDPNKWSQSILEEQK